MPDTHKLRILFVMNPIAGGITKSEMEQTIKEYFNVSVHTYELFHTTGKDDVSSVKHWIKDWKPDRVVAVGGDGTLKLVAEAVVGTNMPVGILPAGSANGMAKEFGLSTDLLENLETIVNGVCEKIDLVEINDEEICLHLSDIGMNAQLVKYFDEKGIRGKFGYARGLIRMLLHTSRMQVSIRNDEKEIKREAFMIVLANARMYGTGALINPDGDLKDGRFEVIIIKRISLVWFIKMFFNAHKYNKNKVEIIPAEQVEIKVKKKAYFQVDGEYKGKVKSIKAKILKHSLCILLPGAMNDK